MQEKEGNPLGSELRKDRWEQGCPSRTPPHLLVFLFGILLYSDNLA